MTLLEKFKGKGLKNRLFHPHDELWDRRLGVHTFGFIPDVGVHSDADWQGHYAPTPYRDVFSMLRHAGVGPSDVVVDLGCGLGRAVFAAHRLGAKRAVGVEIDRQLARQCLESARHGGYPSGAVEFVCAPAQTYSHDDTTVLFMFHPFGAGTMRTVIENVDAALDARPRPMKVIHFNPVHDAVIAESRHLKRVEQWSERQSTPFTAGRYAVSFWRA